MGVLYVFLGWGLALLQSNVSLRETEAREKRSLAKAITAELDRSLQLVAHVYEDDTELMRSWAMGPTEDIGFHRWMEDRMPRAVELDDLLFLDLLQIERYLEVVNGYGATIREASLREGVTYRWTPMHERTTPLSKNEEAIGSVSHMCYVTSEALRWKIDDAKARCWRYAETERFLERYFERGPRRLIYGITHPMAAFRASRALRAKRGMGR
jgi:hypothetical protein